MITMTTFGFLTSRPKLPCDDVVEKLHRIAIHIEFVFTGFGRIIPRAHFPIPKAVQGSRGVGPQMLKFYFPIGYIRLRHLTPRLHMLLS